LGGKWKFPAPLRLLLELLDDVVGVGEEQSAPNRNRTETKLKHSYPTPPSLE